MIPIRMGDLPIDIAREVAKPYAEWRNLAVERARKELGELLTEATLRSDGYYRLRREGVDISAWAHETLGRLVVDRITVRDRPSHHAAGAYERRLARRAAERAKREKEK